MKNMVWALALFGLMFAAGNGTDANSDVRQSIMGMRYAQMECTADFIYSAMDSAEEDGGADLSEDRSGVEAVMAQLRAYVDAGDTGAYNHYMSQLRNAFTTAARNTKQAQVGALNAAGSCGAGGDGGQGRGSGNGTESGGSMNCTQERSQMRDRMRAQYEEARGEYVSCKHEAVVGRIHAEVDEVENWSVDAEETADSMEGRGYNVSRLRGRIAEAEAEADELDEEAGSGATTDELLSERSEKWGHIFYLWAQFHKERINLLLDRFEEKTDGYGTQVAEIRATLDEAAGIGDDEVYTLEEAQQAKALVNQAMEAFSALVEEARGSE